MQLDVETFLRLVENAGTLGFVDIEANGLRGDYNSTLVVSVKPFNKKPISIVVAQPGNDQRVVREAKELLETFDCWVTYYGKGFDLPFLNTRLTKWGMHPIAKRPHIDMYFTLKSNLLTARRSQGHLLTWLGTAEQKMGVSASVWSECSAEPEKNLKILKARCESDVEGLEALYKKTRHLILEIKR